jgi:hypothetical protein
VAGERAPLTVARPPAAPVAAVRQIVKSRLQRGQPADVGLGGKLTRQLPVFARTLLLVGYPLVEQQPVITRVARPVTGTAEHPGHHYYCGSALGVSQPRPSSATRNRRPQIDTVFGSQVSRTIQRTYRLAAISRSQISRCVGSSARSMPELYRTTPPRAIQSYTELPSR